MRPLPGCKKPGVPTPTVMALPDARPRAPAPAQRRPPARRGTRSAWQRAGVRPRVRHLPAGALRSWYPQRRCRSARSKIGTPPPGLANAPVMRLRGPGGRGHNRALLRSLRLAFLVVFPAGADRADARRRARPVLHDPPVIVPAGLLPPGRELGLRAVGEPHGPRPADCGLAAGCKRRVRRYADGHQRHRGAWDRQPSWSFGLSFRSALSLRQAHHGAADLGACAREDLQHADDAGGRLRRRASRPRAASAGTSRIRRKSSTTAVRCSRARRRRPSDTQVNDAITCASRFHSEKGKFDPTMPSYYPPRSDLTTFILSNGSDPPTFAASQRSRRRGGSDPVYGVAYNGTWSIPGTLPPGDYTLMVEVNKEYDSNAAHLHPDFVDSQPAGLGHRGQLRTAIGRLSGPDSHRPDRRNAGRAIDLSDRRLRRLDGATGVINPPDATISTNSPGSGEGRLLCQRSAPAGSAVGCWRESGTALLRPSPRAPSRTSPCRPRGSGCFGHPAVRQASVERGAGPGI